MLALVVCAFQQAELAQLPRERAVAMHLLAIFEQLATAKSPRLKAPFTRPEVPPPLWTRGPVLSTVGAVIVILLLITVVLPPEKAALADAGVVLAAAVIGVFAIRLASDLDR